MRICLVVIICFLLSSSLALAGNIYFTKYGEFACGTLANFNKLRSYTAVGDEKAAKLLFLDDRCIALESAIEVQAMDIDTTRRIVKIRVVGTETTLWTLKASLIPVE